MARKRDSKPPNAKRVAPSHKSHFLSGSAVVLTILIGALAVWSMFGSLHFLDLDNSSKLKEVLFGRDPWVVLCHDGSKSVDSVFEGASTKIRKLASFGIVDCHKPLASGRTIAQRLRLDPDSSAEIFFSGYGHRRQLSSRVLRSEYALVKEVRALTSLHAAKAKSSKSLHDFCASRPHCGLLLSSGELSHHAQRLFNTLSDRYPWVHWTFIDSNKYELANPTEKDLDLPPFQEGVHRLVMLQQHNRTDNEQGIWHIATPIGEQLQPDSLQVVEQLLARDINEIPKKYSLESLELSKRIRHAPQPPVSTPSPQPTDVPTERLEEIVQRREQRRILKEARRREQMEAEAEDFITFEEGLAPADLESIEDSGSNELPGHDPDLALDDEEEDDVVELD